MRPALLLSLLFTACTPAPEIWVLRVAVWPAERSAGCYFPADGPSPNEADDRDTVGAGDTWTIYATGEETATLDLGERAFDGLFTETGFDFGAETVDVSWSNADGTGDKYTQRTTSAVSLTLDGDRVSGEQTSRTEMSCEGDTCAAEYQNLEPCVSVAQVTGTVVPDPELDIAL